MQLGEGVEWALHAVVVLAVVPADSTLPAARLAEYHGVPPAYLAKHLQALSQAGIVESVAGPAGRVPARPAGGRRSPCSTSCWPSKGPRRRSGARRSASAARPPAPGPSTARRARSPG